MIKSTSPGHASQTSLSQRDEIRTEDKLVEDRGQSEGVGRSQLPGARVDAYPAGLSCVLYTFIGDLDEIVEVTFIEFDLQPPAPNG